jgi:hypothetical protein
MSTELLLGQNLDDYDDFYDMMTDSQHGLDERQSKMLNAQLVLVLANHIGDLNVLRQAFAVARINVEMSPPVAHH